MKSFVVLAFLAFTTTSALASELAVVCTSGNKVVYLINENGVSKYANYEVNKVLNSEADVFLEEEFSFTSRKMLFSLNVDGQESKIKVEADSFEHSFPNVYFGVMTFGEQMSNTVCVTKEN